MTNERVYINCEINDRWNPLSKQALIYYSKFLSPFILQYLEPANTLAKSFLEIQPEDLHISALKRSENGAGWIVRIFNPTGKTLAGTIRLNGGWTGPVKRKSPVEQIQSEFTLPAGKGGRWKKVRRVNLEEVPEKDLTWMKPAGSNSRLELRRS